MRISLINYFSKMPCKLDYYTIPCTVLSLLLKFICWLGQNFSLLTNSSYLLEVNNVNSALDYQIHHF